MPTRHMNVFHAYSEGEFGDIEKEKPLENNVTRAFMITLRACPAASRYVLSKLMGIEASDQLSFDLQATLDNCTEEAGSVKKQRRKYVLGISPRRELRKIDVPQALVEAVNRACAEETARRRLRWVLKELSDALREGKERDRRRSELARMLSVGTDTIVGLEESDVRYLYDLTFGSRPDATITDGKGGLTVLVESKIWGSIVDAQIVRHVRENFGDLLSPKYFYYPGSCPDTEPKVIPVCVCSWRDIYQLLDSFHKNGGCQDDPKGDFLIQQLLEYLEDNNMGELKFTQQDFLDWETLKWGQEPARKHAHKMRDHLEDLAKTMSDHLGDSHWVNPQVPSPSYIGVNIVHGRYPEGLFKPVYVPHWSLALEQHGAADRSLRLFVQCESKGLVDRLLKKEGLANSLAQSLGTISQHRGITFRVEEKLFIMFGGKQYKENLWKQSFVFPLEVCQTKDDVVRMVQNAFKVWALLNDRKRGKEITANVPGRGKGKTVVGVLQLNWSLNWFEVERLGVGVERELKDVADLLKPYYEVLLEYAGT